MLTKRITGFLLSALFLFTCQILYSQTKPNLIDGRQHNYCKNCQAVLDDIPKEVLFGLHLNADGSIYFSMNDRQWFEKVFSHESMGVAVDIISKDRYDCSKTVSNQPGVPKGYILPGVYKNDLVRSSNDLMPGYIYAKIGNIPPSLKGKELEGNLVILNGPYICYYTNFVDIDRSVWHLLPMGLFVDSLLSESPDNTSDEENYFTYSNKIKLEIPFAKGSTAFDFNYLKKYYDSINLSSSRIKKVDIRAYSSVEGSETVNDQLMKKRAESVFLALKKYQGSIPPAGIITAENWLDFLQDIRGTKFSNLENLSKFEVKKELLKPAIASEIEPILSKHRKVIITLYLEQKTAFASEKDASLSSEFRNSIASKNISRAQILQKEVFNRISDNKLPREFMDKLEVPKSKEYSAILNDREVYKFLLKTTDEYEALEAFLEIRQIDPDNGKLNYNICALRFFMWQYGNDSLSGQLLLPEINKLTAQGIPAILSNRMKVNYYILKSEHITFR